ncbi:hypothetical protein KBK24_0107155 [Burkholderia sp. K24]|nr:hypothetical protein KBK24_0107155 [Burkholderia sp. K24]
MASTSGGTFAVMFADGPDCGTVVVCFAAVETGVELCAHALMHNAATTAAARRLAVFFIFIFEW